MGLLATSKGLMTIYRVPPLALVLVLSALMYVADFHVPSYDAYPVPRLAFCVMSVIVGGIFTGLGVSRFRFHKTTVNPSSPDTATALVTSGVYSVTRNPMYVGFVIALVGWGSYLGNVASLVFVPAFVLYMNYVQIPLEEKALAAVFGECYSDYKSRIRRWL